MKSHNIGILTSPLSNGKTFTTFNKTVGNIHSTVKTYNPVGKSLKHLKNKLHPKSSTLSIPPGW